MKKAILLSIAAFTILGAGQSAPAQELLSLNQTFVLHPAPREHDSYSLYYNILVRSPGLIRIRLDLENVSPDLAGEVKFLSVSLRQLENEVEVRRSSPAPAASFWNTEWMPTSWTAPKVNTALSCPTGLSSIRLSPGSSLGTRAKRIRKSPGPTSRDARVRKT